MSWILEEGKFHFYNNLLASGRKICIKATIQALISLRDVNEIAEIRGVSISKVFNG